MNKPSILRRLFLLTALMLLQPALDLQAALVESALRAAPQQHWAAEGGKANAWFGFSAAAAGDVNGDGFGDIIVGAHGYDAGLPGQGKVFLFYGSKDGLAPEPA